MKCMRMLLTGALVIGLSGGVLATTSTPSQLALEAARRSDNGQIFNAEEPKVWELTTTTGAAVSEFSPNGTYSVREASNARSWNSDSGLSPNCQGGQSYYCNKPRHQVNFTNVAAVAQWMDWEVTNVRKDWRVLKPGTYASPALEIGVRSNDDVSIYFENFTNLIAQDVAWEEGEADFRPITAYYAIQALQSAPALVTEFPANLTWESAANFSDNLNVLSDTMKGTPPGQSWPMHWDKQWIRLWSLINAHECNKPVNFVGTGTITIQVTTLRDWVADDGSFAATQSGFGYPSL